MRKLIILALWLLRPSLVWAHVFPVRSEPRVGETVNAAPDHISILFDSEMEPVLSSIHVENKEKVQVDKKNSHVDAKDSRKLVVGLLPGLPAGEYHVEWRAVASEGHLTTGHFSFWIKRANP
jgi:methionine-rich copper-binding protein CopC